MLREVSWEGNDNGQVYFASEAFAVRNRRRLGKTILGRRSGMEVRLRGERQ